jgi:hypothetical protein
MTRNRESSEARTNYIDALLQVSGQLTVILHHMWEHESPDADLGPYETLARLLEESIPNRLAQREVDLKLATRLITATSKAVADNIFIVADEEQPFDTSSSNGSERLH